MAASQPQVSDEHAALLRQRIDLHFPQRDMAIDPSVDYSKVGGEVQASVTVYSGLKTASGLYYLRRRDRSAGGGYYWYCQSRPGD